jgi:hypothetical protein
MMPIVPYRSLPLITATLLTSWLGMQAIHELGHVLAARLTGGVVTNVALHPLGISRTDVTPNPQPLAVVWGGPLFGVLAPLAMWAVTARLRWRHAFLLRFFAGFCLVANGLYLTAGSFEGVGDCGVLLRHGAQFWQLCAFGLPAIAIGFWLWNGQSKDFGIGATGDQPTPGATRLAIVAAVLLNIFGLFIGD